ncbi:MAG: putative sugar O-methyltransferase [Planctomycetes bacterium]|nr:putative sugar O-methyltransferase [Planctomycetota bacterium]
MTPNVRPEFFGPRDNFPLSERDWTRVQSLCDAVAGIRERRAGYLARHGLDPKVHLPAHLWGQDFCPSNFRKVARKDRHTIEHLRCLTYNFTGYSMLTMANCENTPEVLEVPRDADAVIRSVAKRASVPTVEFVRCTQGLPPERRATTPRMFGESGWDVDGTIVNYDTLMKQMRLNGLHWSGVFDFLQQRVRERGHARIVEIGAGFGDLAHAFRQIVGPVDYTIVDLPESLVYSSIWLSTVLAGERCTLADEGVVLPADTPGITFVPNHMVGEFVPQIGEVDLVVNMLSLSEMAPQQVEHYGRMASGLLGDEGVFYEQNYIVPGVHTDIVAILARTFGHGALLAETPNPHRGRGHVRMWANAYHGGLWNRGGVTPIAGRRTEAPVELARPAAAPLPVLSGS